MEMVGIWDLLWKWGERASKAWPWVLTVVTTLGTGWIAKASDWLAGYGPISWVICGLLGGLIFSFTWFAIASGMERYQRSRTLKAFKRPEIDGINPLDAVFIKHRIDINAFKNPLPNESVKDKTFVDCELVGPAVIFFLGAANLNNVAWMNCDFVAVDDNKMVQNVIAFETSRFAVEKCIS